MRVSFLFASRYFNFFVIISIKTIVKAFGGRGAVPGLAVVLGSTSLYQEWNLGFCTGNAES